MYLICFLSYNLLHLGSLLLVLCLMRKIIFFQKLRGIRAKPHLSENSSTGTQVAGCHPYAAISFQHHPCHRCSVASSGY